MTPEAQDKHDVVPTETNTPNDAPVDAGTDDDNTRLVPVTEAIRYRKRAQAAEQELSELQTQLKAQEVRLNEANEAIERLERRQRIDALLTESESVDLAVARLLTEQAVSEMDEPDVDLAVKDLRRHKPYLFRQQSYGSPAMAAHPTDTADPAEQAAERAINSGNRRDLLDYLKLRRRATSAEA